MLPQRSLYHQILHILRQYLQILRVARWKKNIADGLRGYFTVLRIHVETVWPIRCLKATAKVL
jgi:hypothetical protein